MPRRHEGFEPIDIKIAFARLDHLSRQLHYLVESKAVERQKDEMKDDDRIIAAQISKC